MTQQERQRGLLIVFEGCDRTGKSTQAQLLQQGLSNAELYKFPNRTSTIGKLIDSYLKSSSEIDPRTLHLLFSANRWEMFQEMKTKLESGISLVCDRYLYSGIVYSVAAHGLDVKWCSQSDIGLLRPDIIFYFDSNASLQDRDGFGDERYEKAELQMKIRSLFREMASRDFQFRSEVLTPGSDQWTIVNATHTIEDIQKAIMEKVKVQKAEELKYVQ